MRRKPKVISLFSGAGGLDVGLEQAGYDVSVAVDFDHDSCETLKANFSNTAVIEGDIQQISTERILQEGNLSPGEVDLLVGGPPCQPFSKSAFWNGSKGLQDPRAVTLHEYIRILREAQPKAFILENVFGLLYKNNKDAFELLRQGFAELGYDINWTVVNTAWYGVPQIRQRLIILGSRIGRLEFPRPTHVDTQEAQENPQLFSGNEVPYVTARDAFKGLTNEWDEVPKELVVAGKWCHLLGDIPPGDNYLFYTEKKGHPNPLFEWRSRYWSFLLKLSPDKPSWTIQAQPGPYVGPFHWESRRLTLGERKRIQTFPDDYRFVGGKGSVQKQIGNAVPCLLGKVLGEAIKKQIFESVSPRDVAPSTKTSRILLEI